MCRCTLMGGTLGAQTITLDMEQPHLRGTSPPPHLGEIASTGSWRLVVPSHPSALLGRHIRLAAASDLLCFLCVFAVLNKTWKRLLECLMRLESAVQTKLPAAGCIILRRETWLHCKSMASWWSKCILKKKPFGILLGVCFKMCRTRLEGSPSPLGLFGECFVTEVFLYLL